jgi:uncharacterized membrane protein YcjF (UPF0283 family)
MVWQNAKTWFIDHCWSLFSMEKWKTRSQTFAVLIGVACILSFVSLVVSCWTQLSMHELTTSHAVVIVPQARVVTINGEQYIPIRMIR